MKDKFLVSRRQGEAKKGETKAPLEDCYVKTKCRDTGEESRLNSPLPSDQTKFLRN